MANPKKFIPGISSQVPSLANNPISIRGNLHDNTAQDVILIPEDKALNYISEYKEAVLAKYKWQTPFMLLVTLLITISTSVPHDALSISAYTWQALFLLGIIVSFIWLVLSVVQLFFLWKKSDERSLLTKMKKTEKINLEVENG